MSTWNAQLARLFLEQKKALEAFVSRRTGNRQVAADLTQEAFLRLARLPGGERIDNLRGFLFTVAGNLVLDHQRQAARRGLVEGELPEHEPTCAAPGLPEQLAAEQEQALLRDAIAALPQPRRRIFLLYHVEGLAYREIAEREATSTRSVEYHLRQALIDCRAFVKARLHPKPFPRTPQP
ncbi:MULTISPECIES: sigma-70 family RNA polymerase sigma factor [unclassified Pseudomonas]|uniref:RNA polymerase sigma factor n=1 Tax=unclassified Pseudomonas TaxID=196821 RepID=UPI00244D49D3|nr:MULTISPECIES: sigma-70 family RNA polymerase sigma factor [unclassified Pseudomonas]MDH0897476.1 sigma-70 family RNA polymerase sigma factor [Pseudomonas sp. GD03875]MDH1067437.1 sigma-70 family RNA polymerase sigma factor [Pseudomonas sp. GD03985]